MKKIRILACVLALGLLCACQQIVTDPAQESKPQEKTGEENKKKETKKETGKKKEEAGKKKSGTDLPDEGLLGTWKMVCRYSYSGEPDEDLEDMESYFSMAEGDGLDVEFTLYEDGGELFADYTNSEYEYYSEGVHMPVEIRQGALYPSCENQEWYAAVMDPETNETLRGLTVVEKDRVIAYDETVYEYEDEDPWFYADVDTFLKEGSEKMEHAEDYRYKETVTVHGAKELLEAIDDDTRIILKGGVYNLSQINGKARNKHIESTDGVRFDGSEYTAPVVKPVTNLCLMAAEDEKVEICIEDPYDPVLTFDGCSYITLDGIIFGHRVEPGTCGGSVIALRGTYNADIKACHLYGSGAYGVESNQSSNINVTDTEIYECTYGITDLMNSIDVTFENCEMHDNTEYAMISVYSCGQVTFRGCNFVNNRVESDYDGRFVSTSDSSMVAFENCIFRDNLYREFGSKSDIELTDCEFHDRPTS